MKNIGVSFNFTYWLAAFWSYSVNHSALWAIFHFICGPAYLAYRIVFFTNLLPK